LVKEVLVMGFTLRGTLARAKKIREEQKERREETKGKLLSQATARAEEKQKELQQKIKLERTRLSNLRRLAKLEADVAGVKKTKRKFGRVATAVRKSEDKLDTLGDTLDSVRATKKRVGKKIRRLFGQKPKRKAVRKSLPKKAKRNS
jgi:vacuolar-type H+-ATPase subunit I/STV1